MPRTKRVSGGATGPEVGPEAVPGPAPGTAGLTLAPVATLGAVRDLGIETDPGLARVPEAGPDHAPDLATTTAAAAVHGAGPDHGLDPGLGRGHTHVPNLEAGPDPDPGRRGEKSLTRSFLALFPRPAFWVWESCRAFPELELVRYPPVYLNLLHPHSTQ